MPAAMPVGQPPTPPAMHVFCMTEAVQERLRSSLEQVRSGRGAISCVATSPLPRQWNHTHPAHVHAVCPPTSHMHACGTTPPCAYACGGTAPPLPLCMQWDCPSLPICMQYGCSLPALLHAVGLTHPCPHACRGATQPLPICLQCDCTTHAHMHAVGPYPTSPYACKRSTHTRHVPVTALTCNSSHHPTLYSTSAWMSMLTSSGGQTMAGPLPWTPIPRAHQAPSRARAAVVGPHLTAPGTWTPLALGSWGTRCLRRPRLGPPRTGCGAAGAGWGWLVWPAWCLWRTGRWGAKVRGGIRGRQGKVWGACGGQR